MFFFLFFYVLYSILSIILHWPIIQAFLCLLEPKNQSQDESPKDTSPRLDVVSESLHVNTRVRA